MTKRMRLKPIMTPPAEHHDRPLKGAGLLVFFVFIISIQDVIVKWISGDYPVHEIVLIRSVLAILPVLLIVRFEGGFKSLHTRHLRGHMVRSAFMFLSYIFFYLALAVLPLAETVTLFFASPLFITILAVAFLHEKVDARGWLAVLAGFCGVVVMLKPGVRIIQPAGVMAVTAAFFYAASAIMSRWLGKTETGVSLVFYPTIMYIGFSAIAGIALNGGSTADPVSSHLVFLFRAWQMPSPGDFLLLIVIAIIAAAAFYCASQAYRLAPPSVLAPLEYIAVPLSAGWGYVIWRELPGPQALIGMLLIVGSGLFRNRMAVRQVRQKGMHKG